MFKDDIDDDGLYKVFKAFYTEEEDANDCRVVMGKMKRYCIGEATTLFQQERKTSYRNARQLYR